MNLGATSTAFVAVAAIVVVAALVTSMGLAAGTTTTTTGQGQYSASVASVDGLSLTLQVSGTRIGYGGAITINVTETNTSNKPLNISAARDWPVQGLRMNACYASVYPFGVAAYQGHYTSENISSARRLNLFPNIPCPLLLRYISGYYFQPSSDLAIVLPGSTPGLRMTSGLVASGNFTSGTNRVQFAPGEYTVAAGDEWGAVVLLYFTVG